eukprot:scaffold84657_cov53-Attheya_sp.AAC.4
METTRQHDIKFRLLRKCSFKFKSTWVAFVMVIWDSGASISISNEKDDFDSPIQSPGIFNSLKGISSGLRNMGKGRVLWEMHDTEGGLHFLRFPAFYVTKCKARLISTTSLLQTYPDESIHITSSRLLLSGSTSRETTHIVAHADPVNNLPTNTGYRSSATVFTVEALNSVINGVTDSNINLSGPSKCLLQCHHHLGHLNFAQIRFLCGLVPSLPVSPLVAYKLQQPLYKLTPSVLPVSMARDVVVLPNVRYIQETLCSQPEEPSETSTKSDCPLRATHNAHNKPPKTQPASDAVFAGAEDLG